ncbi:PREDICTED: centrosomal and chromosomal factor-like [Nicrophorus vespilloides]|uniref:Centrosomal and chromosomal factor-like n=1 Tax=Nicrophorus vespilloides TaxID=110193 RepID=A0ABM1MVI7_NICVS|nr:PREDICTED: centrosomal and chromosomal factor-like [Nicrophorus vespilloides]
MSGASISYPHQTAANWIPFAGAASDSMRCQSRAAVRSVNNITAPISSNYNNSSNIKYNYCSNNNNNIIQSSTVVTADDDLNINTNNNGPVMATCYPSYDQQLPPPPQPPTRTVAKDYSRPLHVDCSVEYELPNQAKPPAGVRNEPLLMIHPCYFRKIESQRRSPFVNNLPQPSQQQQQTTTTSSTPMSSRQTSSSIAVALSTSSSAVTAAVGSKRRSARGQQIPQQVPQQAAQYPVQYAAAESAAAVAARQQLWEPMPPLVPISTCQRYYNVASVSAETSVNAVAAAAGHHHHTHSHWTADTDRSSNRPEDKHILTGKYRQYLRAHRLHPYVTSAIPIASTFPQIQQVCYNV